MNARLVTVAGIWLASVMFAGSAMATGETSEPVPVIIENSQEILLPSPGGDLRLLVWQPAGTPPATGYPVIYVLDGGESFGLFSDLAARIARRARRTGQDPAMVVAIGYPRGAPSPDRRIYDLSPPLEPGHVMPNRPDGEPWPALGGGDAFLDRIETEVRPVIRSRFPADPRRETLYGHSFGGLLVLHALFSRPGAFHAYVASSPSLWYNGRQIFDAARRFLATPRASAAAPIRVRVTVGGNEQTVTPQDRAQPEGDAYAAWKLAQRMVDNARELAALIAAGTGAGNVRPIDLSFTVIPDTDHGSAWPASAYDAITFAIGGAGVIE